MRGSLLLLALTLVALEGCDSSIVVSADAWPEANALFQSDLRWVGGDGAVTIPLGGDRVLWLFGDSSIAYGNDRERDGAAFIRNSAAVQTGLDPAHAFMSFYWSNTGAGPSSFIPEQGSNWLWPGQGARIGDTLLLFYGIEESVDTGSGFTGASWTALLVDNPDDEPSQWAPRAIPVPDSHDLNLGEAVFMDGDYLYAAGEGGGTDHDTYLARWLLADAGRGDLSQPEWWCGDSGYSQTGTPAVIISGAAPELSIQHDTAHDRWLEVETVGYGSTYLGVRSAKLPEGPWSDPQEFYVPPQSSQPDAFVYAGKAHPGLTGADLVVTYVPSSFSATNDDPTLYYPYFVRATFAP